MSNSPTTSPNHALQRTAPRVTVAANSSSNPFRPSVALSYARSLSLRSTTQLPRHAPPSLSLGSLGDFAHLLRVMSASGYIPSSMPPTKLHALKTSSSESNASPTVWPSVASRPFCCPALPKSARRESPASSTALLLGIYREATTSTRSTRGSAERLDRATVFGFASSRAFTESQLSRHSPSGIYRESGRASRNSFRASVLNPMKSPNHALQRTAPHVTAPASAAALPPTMQVPRRAPLSLSLGSLGVFTR